MRNYLKAADRFKASVFLVHGLADWNVKPTHCVNLFAAMESRGIPCKMMLHQGGHIYIHDLQGSRFNEMLHLWLDHWLYGIENGAAERIPNVLVQSNLDQDLWLASPSFPAVKGYTEPVLMPAQASGRLVDDLSATVYDRTRDNAAEWLAELVLSERHAHCLRYITAPLETDTRISGTVQVSCRLPGLYRHSQCHAGGTGRGMPAHTGTGGSTGRRDSMGKQHTVGGLEALPVGREALCLQGDLPRLDECPEPPQPLL